MNTVITPVIDSETDEFLGYDFNDKLGDLVIQSLLYNNSFVPSIDRVVFNTKVPEKSSDQPILVTVVYFKDGTKVTVKNSDKDTVTLEKKTIKLSDGTETEVTTASEASKEIGILYALVKRIICDVDENGSVSGGTKLARFLKNTIDGAHDQIVDSARVVAEKKISKQRAKKVEEVHTANPKKEKNSLRESVNKLNNVLDTLISKLSDRWSSDRYEEENVG